MSKWRQYARRAGRILKKSAPYIKTAAKIWYASSGSKTTTKSRRGGDYGGTTSQYDHKVQYRKKRGNKRKRKQWKRFARKVKAVEKQDRGLQTVIMNNSKTFLGLSGQQVMTEAHLWSNYSADNTAGLQDKLWVYDFSANGTDEQITGSGATPYTVSAVINNRSKEFNMSSMVMDVTYSNTSATGCEMDLYEIGYKKNADARYNSFEAGIVDATATTRPIQAAVPAASDFDVPSYKFRGVTLFDLSQAISTMGFKIYKKEKFFIPAGNTVTKQIRVPKQFLVKGNTQNLNCFQNSLTRSLIGIAKSVDTEGVPSITQKWTRTYRYTCEGQNNEQAAYLLNR